MSHFTLTPMGPDEHLNKVLGSLAERFDPSPNPYLGRPVEWTNERLGEYVTADQQKIMESVRDHRYTAVQSCHDVGKSFTGSRLVGYWIDVHPLGEAFAVSTAPTAAQVGTILWREIGKAHRKGGLPGRINGNNEWKIEWPGGTDEKVGQGRKPADYDLAAFQGIHSRYPLIVIDEACGVDQRLYEAIDSLATNRHARVLAIGNPDDPSSYFAQVCQPGSGWNVIKINALNSPNFTAEEVNKYPAVKSLMIQKGIPPNTEPIPDDLRDLLVEPLWVDERIKRWGVDSPIFKSKVLGEFPNVAVDSLIHPHWVELAKSREVEPVPMFGRLGVDVARYGTDRTIILNRMGGWARVWKEIASGPVTEVAGFVIMLLNEVYHSMGIQIPTVAVDDTGVGGGVTDILVEQGFRVIPVVAGSAASHSQVLPNGKPRFLNKRAELMWNMREAFMGPSGTGEDGWIDIDPLDIELHAQLTNIKYKVRSNGQIQVESKEDMAARGLPSPDRADALSYSLAPDEQKWESVVKTDRMVTSDLETIKW